MSMYTMVLHQRNVYGLSMPHRSEDRDRTDEQIIAARINYEREARGWSMRELSRRLTAVGQPIPPTAISRMLSPKDGDKPRRITADEVGACARVFDMPVGELFELPASKVSRVQWQRLETARTALDDALSEWVTVAQDIADALGDSTTKVAVGEAYQLVNESVLQVAVMEVGAEHGYFPDSLRRDWLGEGDGVDRRQAMRDVGKRRHPSWRVGSRRDEDNEYREMIEAELAKINRENKGDDDDEA